MGQADGSIIASARVIRGCAMHGVRVQSGRESLSVSILSGCILQSHEVERMKCLEGRCYTPQGPMMS